MTSENWKDHDFALPSGHPSTFEAECKALRARVAELLEALEQLVIEYDEVDLATAEPLSFTSAVNAARAAIEKARGDA